MAENSQGKKYGHEINFHGPYLDGQINLTFHVVSSSSDQITTIKEIADLIREEGTIPATGNYTYYEKQEEKKEVEKKEEAEVAKDETPGTTPRPFMKIVEGIQVDGDGIKPIFTKEENSVEPKIMTMSLESVSASDVEPVYPTILSAEAPAVLADSSDDSKLITFGNLKKFAELTDARYVQLKSDDPAPGSYATITELKNCVKYEDYNYFIDPSGTLQDLDQTDLISITGSSIGIIYKGISYRESSTDLGTFGTVLNTNNSGQQTGGYAIYILARKVSLKYYYIFINPHENFTPNFYIKTGISTSMATRCDLNS